MLNFKSIIFNSFNIERIYFMLIYKKLGIESYFSKSNYKCQNHLIVKSRCGNEFYKNNFIFTIHITISIITIDSYSFKHSHYYLLSTSMPK